MFSEAFTWQVLEEECARDKQLYEKQCKEWVLDMLERGDGHLLSKQEVSYIWVILNVFGSYNDAYGDCFDGDSAFYVDLEIFWIPSKATQFESVLRARESQIENIAYG